MDLEVKESIEPQNNSTLIEINECDEHNVAETKNGSQKTNFNTHTNLFDKIGGNVYPIQFEFKDIRFEVKKKKQMRTILNGITGIARSGRLLAIMGASGAGKSSFLSIVTGRIGSNKNMKISGEILMNGEAVSGKTFKKYTAYVMQQDLHFQTLTPREALTFAAKLKLPKSTKSEDVDKKVNAIMEALSLMKCADSYIGGASIKGISGGERKRLSIGIELITNPAMLFIDEPTSGLDSHTALKIMKLLSMLANSGRTIITTIHQPNSEIFTLFDDLMLLSEGQVAFLGESSKGVDYFSNLGYCCPNFTNPADYFVDIIQISDDDKDSKSRIELFFKNCHENVNKYCNSVKETNLPVLSNAKDQIETAGVGNIRQTYLLTWRSFFNFIRLPETFLVRLAQALLFSLIVGLIFFRLNPNAQQPISGALFFIAVNVCMSSVMAVVLSFPIEKQIIIRELGNGMYSIFPYFFSKFLSELPFNILFVGFYCAISYPMVGLGPSFIQQFKFVVPLLMGSYISYFVGMILGSISASPSAAVSAVPVFTLPFLLFSGYFIQMKYMQKQISQIAYINYYRYLMESLSVNQFDNTESGKLYLEQLGYSDVKYINQLGVLIGLSVGVMCISCTILYFKTKKNKFSKLQKQINASLKDIKRSDLESEVKETVDAV